MSTVSTTGTISSAGIGSGLDVNSLVTQLVAAERAPQDRQLATATTTTNGQLSAYKAIQAAMTSLQTAEKALQGGTGAFGNRSAVSADETVFSATAASGAVPGAYSIEVKSLATANKLASTGFASTATAIGTGHLTIAVGSSQFSLDIDSTDNTPTGIRDAINDATDNTGVTASLITADDGVHVVLSAKETGTSHAITVTASGGDGGLNSLVYDPANNNKHLTELTKAIDAVVSVEGYPYTSASNLVSGSIPGVTIDLISAKPGTTLNLSVSRDTSGVSSAVQNFVSAYNSFANIIKATTAYDPTTKAASWLTGDSLARSAQAQIRNALIATTAGTTGGVRSLFDLGISTGDDGTLSLDSSKLNIALSGNFDAVATLFSSTGAVGSAMQHVLDGFIGTSGALGSRTDSLTKRLGTIGTQRTQLDARMAAIQARYTAQFSALDTLMSQMNATSTFLTNQFSPKTTS